MKENVKMVLSSRWKRALNWIKIRNVKQFYAVNPSTDSPASNQGVICSAALKYSLILSPYWYDCKTMNWSEDRIKKL